MSNVNVNVMRYDALAIRCGDFVVTRRFGVGKEDR